MADNPMDRLLADIDRAGRERCVICGMVANVDPEFHAERYGHLPEVIRGGRRLRFDASTYTFSIEVTDGDA